MSFTADLKRLGDEAGGWFAKQVAARVPKADMDARDPDYIRDNLPFTWLISSLWFRGEVRGLERIPADGPVLIVGNHSGGNVPPDTFVFTLAFASFFGVERRFYQLAHNLVVTMPFPGAMLRKWGTIAASRDNAHAVLQRGDALLVYPGGDYEVFRPSWERHKVDFGGRKGFLRLALEERVPIVPLVSIGGQEAALFLSRGEWLAKLLRLDKTLRLKSLPISLALPWGLNISDLAGHLPLPTKIVVEALEPIDLHERYGDDPDIDKVYEDVIGLMQDALDQLASERKLPVIG
ncbi:MAG TPA: lysophospholipid acyltransferase family protein [Frankiaceae bacterium]|nr:lysophospholipid acyltransferase family protein [Frankiaceae bacterium]